MNILFDFAFEYFRMCQILPIMRYLLLNKRMIKHYRTRRILINAVPFLIVFSIYYYIYDLKPELYILRKTQCLSNLTPVSKWNATLQKIANMPNETESNRSDMVSFLQALKKHVTSDIENMA